MRRALAALAALAVVQAAVAQDGIDERAFHELGAASGLWKHAGRFDDALASLDKVLALNPKAEDAKAMRRRVEADQARR